VKGIHFVQDLVPGFHISGIEPMNWNSATGFN